MLLMELFSSGDMKTKLRQAALDIITPFLGQHLPFITIQQVIDGLNRKQMGISLNPGLVKDILSPDAIKAVSRIEGDRIYLTDVQGDEEEQQQDEQPDVQQGADHVNDMAQQGAKKAIQNQ